MEENDLDLEQQLSALGINNLGVVVSSVKDIPTPHTPENPTNEGIVTNSVVPQPIQQTVQEKVNNEAAAQVVQQSTTAPVQSQQTVVYTPNIQNTKTTNKESLEDDEITYINFSRAMSSSKTSWLTLKDGEHTRILLVDPNKVINLKEHWVKDLGWCKCLSKYDIEGRMIEPATCCKKVINTPQGPMLIDRLDEDGNPIKVKDRFLVPVIEYPVDKNTGKIISGRLPQLKIWNMNVIEWGDLREAINIALEYPEEIDIKELQGIDFIAHKERSGRFSKTSINAARNCAKQDYLDTINAEIAKVDNEFMKTAVKEARKVVSEETIAKLMDSAEFEAASMNRAVNNAIENDTMGNQVLDI